MEKKDFLEIRKIIEKNKEKMLKLISLLEEERRRRKEFFPELNINEEKLLEIKKRMKRVPVIPIIIWGPTNSGKSTLINSLISGKPIKKYSEGFLPTSLKAETVYFHHVQLEKFGLNRFEIFEHIETNYESISTKESQEAKDIYECSKKFCSRNELVKLNSNLNESKYFKSIITTNNEFLSELMISPKELIDTPGIYEAYSHKKMKDYLNQNNAVLILVISFGQGTVHKDVEMLINDQKVQILGSILVIVTKSKLYLEGNKDDEEEDDEEEIEAKKESFDRFINIIKEKIGKNANNFEILLYDQEQEQLDKISQFIRDNYVNSNELLAYLISGKDMVQLINEEKKIHSLTMNDENLSKVRDKFHCEYDLLLKQQKQRIFDKINNYFEKSNFSKEILELLNEIANNTEKIDKNYFLEYNYRKDITKILEKEFKDKIDKFLQPLIESIFENVVKFFKDFIKQNNVKLNEKPFNSISNDDNFILSQVFILGVTVLGRMSLGLFLESSAIEGASLGTAAISSAAISGITFGIGLAVSIIIAGIVFLHFNKKSVNENLTENITEKSGKICSSIKENINSVVFDNLSENGNISIDNLFDNEIISGSKFQSNFKEIMENFQTDLKILRKLTS